MYFARDKIGMKKIIGTKFARKLKAQKIRLKSQMRMSRINKRECESLSNANESYYQMRMSRINKRECESLSNANESYYQMRMSRIIKCE